MAENRREISRWADVARLYEQLPYVSIPASPLGRAAYGLVRLRAGGAAEGDILRADLPGQPVARENEIVRTPPRRAASRGDIQRRRSARRIDTELQARRAGFFRVPGGPAVE